MAKALRHEVRHDSIGGMATRSDTSGSLMFLHITTAAYLILLGLVVALFARVDSGVGRAAWLAVFVFWALRIVYVYFRKDVSQPDLLVWLARIAPDVVVLAALWHIGRKYS